MDSHRYGAFPCAPSRFAAVMFGNAFASRIVSPPSSDPTKLVRFAGVPQGCAVLDTATRAPMARDDHRTPRENRRLAQGRSRETRRAACAIRGSRPGNFRRQESADAIPHGAGCQSAVTRRTASRRHSPATAHDATQDFYVSRPAPAAELSELLRAPPGRSAGRRQCVGSEAVNGEQQGLPMACSSMISARVPSGSMRLSCHFASRPILGTLS